METNRIRPRIAALLAAPLLLLGAASGHAVTLNNVVNVVDVMMWNQDLSDVTSTTATFEYIDNGDGTFSYTGTEDKQGVWGYDWSLTADPDPLIGGSITITNMGSAAQVFDITFSLPISPSFTNGFMTGSLGGSFKDNNGDGASLTLNDWDGLIDGASQMSLLAFGGSCLGAGCSFTLSPVSDGPNLYTGPVNSTIGIHMNFTLSAGDQVTFDTSFEVNPVPVPAAAWLFGSGLLGLVAAARRRTA